MNIFDNLIPIEFRNLIMRYMYGWITRSSHIWKKDQNLLRNTTATPQVIIKICWLIQQLNAPDSLYKPKRKSLPNWVLNLRILTQSLKPTGQFQIDYYITRKYQIYHPVSPMTKLFQISLKKLSSLIHILLLSVSRLLATANYLL